MATRKSSRKMPVCIYVDNSNIFIGAQEVAKRKREDSFSLRLDFKNFLSLITQGDQPFSEMVWAGSSSKDHEAIFPGLEEKGIDLQIIPRAESGENETVDQAIQLSMYRHARKYTNSAGTMVLCTGDGKGYHEEKGFLYDVHGFIEDGWTLILYSWNLICHQHLKEYATQHGTYIQLEKYYKSITFIKDKRHATPLEQKSKPIDDKSAVKENSRKVAKR